MKKRFMFLVIGLVFCLGIAPVQAAAPSVNSSMPIPELVYVEGGAFTDQFGDRITVGSFYIGKYEVTFDQFDAYCDAVGIPKPDDQRAGRGSRPVLNVSWYDALRYCNWLSKIQGLEPVYEITNEVIQYDSYHVYINHAANGYRLPTADKWEYAARGGSQSKGYKYSGSNDIDAVAWYWDNAGEEAHPVGQKQPNELGIYDMSGNVSELCWDFCYEAYGRRIFAKGGSWRDDPVPMGGSVKGPDEGSRHEWFGFRIARNAGKPSGSALAGFNK